MVHGRCIDHRLYGGGVLWEQRNREIFGFDLLSLFKIRKVHAFPSARVEAKWYG